ncbi:tail fiber domain-containing protein [Salinactinospora qingdaonensis]|uniref:Peptidase S74 domain-containing protein n=1 Tax=Salinactinospora qingdaonensis TaxID=702744 RepID=A0ABP7G452_9ACTN
MGRNDQGRPDTGAARPQPPAPVNGFEVLTKLAALPVSTWRYDWEPEHVRHLGPMAQDFHATFGLGETTTTIPMVDANGVVMVAVQALHRLVTDLREEVAHLRHQLDQVHATGAPPATREATDPAQPD